MRIKNNLVLREIVGQYIIVPVMEMAKEMHSMLYVSSSAAFLWENMQGKDFEIDGLTDLLMGKYKNVTREKAREDTAAFVEKLRQSGLLLESGDE